MDALKLSSSVHQQHSLISVDAGNEVTLSCFYAEDVAMFYWYKQSLGEKPRLIATFYKYEKNGTFYGELKNNKRFNLATMKGKIYLIISDLRTSDSATYYCATSYTFIFEFAESTVVSVHGSGLNIPAQVHQSASESIQPGGSVTLNCTSATKCPYQQPIAHQCFELDGVKQLHNANLCVQLYVYTLTNHQCRKENETKK
uniref:Ig-like domain-containing protein n=1 Tax=Mastacembelus armatus TaxID=205130 RepID=A0A3Q3LF04_9TELE